ncbi:DUF294 nucleotidyltransferase-like domain-containing protein [Psychromonas ossibalaenae]|uniref:DUF294 nucleotidyltransferase-like domain-containing protein n=1 Tax=Psychromonas ossibalaenae TaxID=444922 RepID=UPI000368CDA9|nr:DUF294 nucleotidyltransferase-like domain-containing protein [Psychromonas ossibalaenae]
MDVSELQPVRDFVSSLPPFDILSDQSLRLCCISLSVVYYSRNEQFVEVDANERQLYIVRSGAFEVLTEQGQLIDRISDGQYFGFSGMLSGEKVVNKVRILEDALVYLLPVKIFDQLRAASRQFDRFFNQAFAQRLRHQGAIKSKNINTSRISSVVSADLISIGSSTTIQQAAELMSEKRVSSLLIIDNNKLNGIITDRDLRSRVLAKGLDGQTLVKQVMTTDPLTSPKNALIFEAMLQMSENSIHHLPIIEDGRPTGMLTSTDIMRSQSSQPLLLIGQIGRQNSQEELIAVSRQIPQLLQNLISSDAQAQEIGRILTSVTDALTRRLITISQNELGEAPMQFCWLAFGSQARQDQVAGADQDNALLLEFEPDPGAQLYFQALSQAVCTGLNACGYSYCPGDIMATNQKWQLSLKQWENEFSKWVNTPQPAALLNATIFFDIRCIFGSYSLFESLQNKVLNKTKDNDIFLAAMTDNALQQSPPLGFFRDFVLERDGSEVKGIDLKHKGTALINDITRIYALAAGIKEVNTHKRLVLLKKSKFINHQDAHNLIDACEFIARKRLSNQGYQYSHSQQLSNYLQPQNLSALARHQLKDAFKAVHEAQAGIKLKFLRQF